MRTLQWRTSIWSVLFIAALALAVGLTSCGRRNGGGRSARGNAGTPVQGDWLIIHSLSDPEDLNLITATDAGASEIQGLFYETLTTTDWTTLKQIPFIADSLPRISADRLSYDVTIRKDVRFSDGKPVTANDFIFYLKAVKNPYITNAAPLRSYYARVESAELIDNDPYRMRVKMNEPYYLGDQWVGGMSALPKHILDPEGLTDKMTFAELNQNDPKKNPAIQKFADWFQEAPKKRDKKFLVASGPYMFEEWNRGDRVVLVRAPNYWKKSDPIYGRAYPDRIIWRTINDGNAALAALKKGEIDFMPNIEKILYNGGKKSFDRFNLVPDEYNYPSYTYVGYNEDRPLFQDKLVRQALAYAINRDAIIKTIYFGLARPVQSPILPQRPEADTSIPIIKYDLNKAKELLTRAGWSDTDGDGILDKVINGRKTPFRFTIILNTGNKRRESMALIFAQELRKLGIEAVSQPVEWTLFLNRTRDGDYDAMIGGWAMGVLEGDMYQIWHSKSAEKGGSNHVRFRNKRVDELIEAIRSEFDFEKRKNYYREIQQIINDEQPYNFLVTEKLTGAHNNRFENVQFYAPRPCYVPAWWWVPAQAQKYKGDRPMATK